MEERAFNLCREPWICVLDRDYRVKKLSLYEVLTQSSRYMALAGETETQNIAVLRLLLALLHTVFYRQDEEGNSIPLDDNEEALRRWKAIWELGEFPKRPIEDYLEKWEDRFWLFDPQYPFYQVPGITGTSNPAKKMNGALVESSNKIQLFPLRSGRRKEELAFDEAARWLVYLQAFDDTAAKDPSPKQCWPSCLGLVIVRAKSLFETLMLNLALLKNGIEPWGEPKPSWERNEVKRDKRTEIAQPDNQPELLSMQCRRVLLHRNGDVVDSYVDAAGDYLEKENVFSEQMTLWTVQRKGKETERTVPKPHDPARQMWRDFASVCGSGGREPGVLVWVKTLKKERILGRDRLVALQIAGLVYGGMNCGVVDEFSDALELHASLLEDLDRKWQDRVVDEVAYCEQLAKAVCYLALALYKAQEGDGKAGSAKQKQDEKKKQVEDQLYYRFDLPFRRWLRAIDPEGSLSQGKAHLDAWKETAADIAKAYGRELAEQAGPRAIVGRTVKEKIGSKELELHYSAGEALNSFLYQVKKIQNEHDK